MWHAIVQAVLFNFWTYGLQMPAVLTALDRQSALTIPAFGSASVIALLVACLSMEGHENVRDPNPAYVFVAHCPGLRPLWSGIRTILPVT